MPPPAHAGRSRISLVIQGTFEESSLLAERVQMDKKGHYAIKFYCVIVFHEKYTLNKVLSHTVSACLCVCVNSHANPQKKKKRAT